jgi:hypothetical protein
VAAPLQCDRCAAGPAGADQFDQCDLCGQTLCDECIVAGCCGQIPTIRRRFPYGVAATIGLKPTDPSA